MSLKSNIGPFRYGVPPEVPKERVLRELEDVKSMVAEWKKSYMRIVEEYGPYDLAVNEFWMEIEEYVLPWLDRMFAVGFIDENEYEDTIRYFVALVEELRYEINLLKEVKDA
ncbi:MAG: hypothetical protein ACPLSJ_02910 [Thermosulfidibacteraceae bacterium]